MRTCHNIYLSDCVDLIRTQSHISTAACVPEYRPVAWRAPRWQRRKRASTWMWCIVARGYVAAQRPDQKPSTALSKCVEKCWRRIEVTSRHDEDGSVRGRRGHASGTNVQRRHLCVRKVMGDGGGANPRKLSKYAVARSYHGYERCRLLVRCSLATFRFAESFVTLSPLQTVRTQLQITMDTYIPAQLQRGPSARIPGHPGRSARRLRCGATQ